jgi:DNA-binding MarR family transcriptional regulator
MARRRNNAAASPAPASSAPLEIAPPARLDREAKAWKLDPDDSIGYLLRDTYRYFMRLLGQRIEQHGVTMGQWFFLRVLWQQDGLTQAELSSRAAMMTPTTVAALNTLESKGLIERRAHPTDRRKYNVYLTKAGRQLERQLLPYAHEVTAIAAGGATPEQMEETRAALRKVRANLMAEIERTG